MRRIDLGAKAHQLNQDRTFGTTWNSVQQAPDSDATEMDTVLHLWSQPCMLQEGLIEVHH